MRSPPACGRPTSTPGPPLPAAIPAEGAAGAVRLALLPDDGPTGGFFSWDGTTLPW